MAELTTTQRFIVQTQSGIGTAEGVFTNDQLDTFYDYAGSDVDKTILFVLRSIAADTAKLHDYRIAQSAENLSQVHKQIKGLVEYWEEQVQSGDQQVYFGAYRSVPPVDRKQPSDGRRRTRRGYPPNYDPE